MTEQLFHDCDTFCLLLEMLEESGIYLEAAAHKSKRGSNSFIFAIFYFLNKISRKA